MTSRCSGTSTRTDINLINRDGFVDTVSKMIWNGRREGGREGGREGEGGVTHLMHVM